MFREFRNDLKKVAIAVHKDGETVRAATDIMMKQAPVDATVAKATNWLGNTSVMLGVAGIFHTTKLIDKVTEATKRKLKG